MFWFGVFFFIQKLYSKLPLSLIQTKWQEGNTHKSNRADECFLFYMSVFLRIFYSVSVECGECLLAFGMAFQNHVVFQTLVFILMHQIECDRCISVFEKCAFIPWHHQGKSHSGFLSTDLLDFLSFPLEPVLPGLIVFCSQVPTFNTPSIMWLERSVNQNSSCNGSYHTRVYMEMLPC